MWGENVLRKLQAILMIVLALTGCQRPSSSRVYSSPGNLSYRVDFYGGTGAVAPSSTAVFAVLKTSAGSSEKLVLSGTYMDIQSIALQSDGQGTICLSGGYTETYRRIVALSVGTETTAVYTHLSDSCPK
jgi:hypothetical protein